jgi:uncharacterized RDD family membrane protein YckC
MSRDTLIETPENVALEYELGGLGTRFVAHFLDLLIVTGMVIGVFVLTLLLVLVTGYVATIEHIAWLSRLIDTLADFEFALAIIATFVLFFGYFIYFEYKWNGQSPGKRSAGLRVIREGGYPVDLFSVIVRNLIRIMDFLPAFYFIGIASILFAKRYQRLGDFMAGTLVVKQRAPKNLINLLAATRLQPEHLDREALMLMVREADRLTPDEYRAVRHYTERRRSLMTFAAQQQSAYIIALPLMQRLGIAPPAGVTTVNYADVLEYLAVAYETVRRPAEQRRNAIGATGAINPNIGEPNKVGILSSRKI